MNSWFTRPSLRSYTQCFLSSLEPRYPRCLHLLTSSPTPTHRLYRPAVSVELNLSRAGLQSLPLPCHLPFSSLGSFFPRGHVRHFLATTHWRRPWCWERLKAREKGTTEDEMVGWHHWLMDMRLSKLREIMKDREAWRAVIHGVAKVRHDWATEHQQQHYPLVLFLSVRWSQDWNAAHLNLDPCIFRVQGGEEQLA